MGQNILTARPQFRFALLEHAVEIGKGFGHFHHTAYNIASAYALLNNPEQAIKWLKVAADDGPLLSFVRE